MRSALHLVGGLSLAFFLWGSVASASTSCASVGPGSNGEDVPVSRIVDAMNNAGLHDFKLVASEDMGVSAQGEGISPFAEWYVHFMGNLSAGAPGALAEQHDALDLVRHLNSLSGLSISGAIWVDETGTSYNRDRAKRIFDALCAPTTAQRWSATVGGAGANRRVPVIPLINAWLKEKVGQMEAPLKASDIVDTENGLAYAMMTLQARINFVADASGRFDRAQTLPYYSDGSLEGIRLDAADSSLAVYLITGTRDAISKLRDSLDITRWKRIRSAFVSKAVFIQGAMLDRAPRTAITFENIFGTPGCQTQAMAFDLEQHTARISVINGFAGRIDLPYTACGTAPDVGFFARVPMFSAVRPVFYAVEDRATQALLLVGAQTPSPCRSVCGPFTF